MAPNVRKHKFKAVRSTHRNTVVVRQPNTAWHDAKFDEVTQARWASRSELEMVDAQLRRGQSVVDGSPRESWGLDDGKVAQRGRWFNRLWSALRRR